MIGKHGVPDIVVNNAGIHVKKPAIEMTDEDFDSVLRTHLSGAFALTRAAARPMLERGSGSFVFISSMTGYMGMPLVAGYSTAKTGVIGLVRTLSAEFAPKGVRVNAIAPGWIDTPMLRKAISADSERERKIRGRIQIEGFGEPSDVGYAAVYLCSPAARYLTGVILPVDGGGHASFYRRRQTAGCKTADRKRRGLQSLRSSSVGFCLEVWCLLSRLCLGLADLCDLCLSAPLR